MSLQLPDAFVKRIQKTLGKEFKDFTDSLNTEAPTSFRINPNKFHLEFSHNIEKVSWSNTGFYLDQRPSFISDPLFHNGSYYVQEAGSMFLEQAIHFIKSQTENPLLILDLCASPGGKSTHILSLIDEQDLLISNEVINSRANTLKENIIKWGAPNVIVTSNSIEDFENLGEIFDVILIDAPCSGEGMFRKNHLSVNEWSENNALLCENRQTKLLHKALKCLKTNGYLIYSTCTFNPDENENNLEKLAKQYQIKCIALNTNNKAVKEVKSSNIYGYYFYPHLTKSEGFFLSLFQKQFGKIKSIKVNKPEKNKESSNFSNYLNDAENFIFLKDNNTINALFINHLNIYKHIKNKLNILFFGIEIGNLTNKNFKPSPYLPFSIFINVNCFNKMELEYNEIIEYLKRNTLSINSDKGIHLVTFKNQNIGFINSLGNRLNNLYPKEWRILNQNLKHDYTPFYKL